MDVHFELFSSRLAVVRSTHFVLGQISKVAV